jgi:thymidylate synthase ThyX
MSDVLTEIDQDQAGSFLETFYYQYGHASIADMAHVPIGVEDVSILAAMEIVDEALWDGQERSTRYQDFSKPRYYQPDNADPAYVQMMEQAFTRYTEATERVVDAIRQRLPKPSDMTLAEYNRTVKAKAFDITRYFLPLGALTSLGQVTSARTLSRQISRLRGSEYPEIVAIAGAMQEAAQQNAPFRLDGTEEGPLLPTLVRHTSPSVWDTSRRVRAEQLFDESGLKRWAVAQPAVPSVDVVDLTQYDPVDAMLALSFYEVSAYNLRSILTSLVHVSPEERVRLFDFLFGNRVKHDEWAAAFSLAPLAVDFTIDVGGYRDLNRHRRLRKVKKPLQYVEEARFGYSLPLPLSNVDLGVATDVYESLASHCADVRSLPVNDPKMPRIYLQPLAMNIRSLFLMDYAQAAYMIELRSKPSGHFSYRKAMQEMHERLQFVTPHVAKHIRVSTEPWDRITLER